ncbi:MAG: hypothetical protein QOG64_2447 [Acidimicrobiaceae bacterium]|nr:hypothetical protein [Acidimicrobiaceae bacterium]
MAFMQIIEMHTKKFDELKKLDDEWEKATEGERTLQRSIVARDRKDPDRYILLAFFDSYESAMENSNLPKTTEFAEKQVALLDGPPTFTDLDIIDDRS